MKLQKYLAILSYNGKSFSGSQIQNVKDQRISTVQKSLQVKSTLLGNDLTTFP
jgi:tRNA U38,U39,U40 pseudouridine synthase TruA